MILQKNSHTLAIFICLTTLFGVSFHDSKADKLATIAIGIPAVVASHSLGGVDHTHVERFSVERTVGEVREKVPRIRPRFLEDRHFSLEKSVPKGHHPFDNYNLPLIPA